ncbi:hypothetical protein [Phenylobacterium aquaticum]|uniref:hypothetical protein n=1 Tax=Phenylobacterium aquaticum TaxID=1763816 RepID=UPI0026E9AC1E|nr:hypothetical protein [Phenylobacterium aquaticum]
MSDVPLRVSREAELDRRLEDLIAKMVAKTATQAERGEYRTLSARRTRLMRPQRPSRPMLLRGRQLRAHAV